MAALRRRFISRVLIGWRVAPQPIKQALIAMPSNLPLRVDTRAHPNGKTPPNWVGYSYQADCAL